VQVRVLSPIPPSANGTKKRAFLGWLRGEREHYKMVAIPTIVEECQAAQPLVG